MHGADTFGTGSNDVDWLPPVGTRGWVLITKDKNIRKNPLELRALRQAKVAAFVLTSGNLRGVDQARIILEALPAMLRLLARTPRPFVARITAESSVQLIDSNKYLAGGHDA